MAKVYHDVIVQVADDPDFIENVRTIFNNDSDNTSGLGVGTDREYFETLRRQADQRQRRQSPLHSFLLQRQHRERSERIHRARSLRPPGQVKRARGPEGALADGHIRPAPPSSL